MSLHPRQLPKLRDQTLAHLDNPASALRANTGGEYSEGLDALASMLRHGSLYWARQDMTALSMSAGSRLDTAEWDVRARPSESGLIVFEGGVGSISTDGVDVPIEACAWGSFEGECAVWLLLSRRRLVNEITVRETGVQIAVEETPPLMPVSGFSMETEVPTAMAEIAADAPEAIVRSLAAAWLLMGQPTLVDTSTERPDRAVRKAYARQGRPDPEVTLVDLRRQYVPQDRDGGEGEQGGRRYRHRFVVSGHWRDQPYGPERALRRKTWIPAYIKGPDGAPMLTSEKVNVWKR